MMLAVVAAVLVGAAVLFAVGNALGAKGRHRAADLAASVRFGPGRHPAGRVPIRARDTAELTPDAGAGGLPTHATGGGYDGPLAFRQGKPMLHLFLAL